MCDLSEVLKGRGTRRGLGRDGRHIHYFQRDFTLTNTTSFERDILNLRSGLFVV